MILTYKNIAAFVLGAFLFQAAAPVHAALPALAVTEQTEGQSPERLAETGDRSEELVIQRNSLDSAQLETAEEAETPIEPMDEEEQNPADSLIEELQMNEARRAAFNRLFATNIPATGEPSLEDRGKVNDVVFAEGYDETQFLGALVPTDELHARLQGDAALRADFNLIYGTALGATGTPSASDRAALFAVGGAGGYNEESYVRALENVGDLYRQLQASASDRADFNLMYGTAIGATGKPGTGARSILFGIGGDPAYLQSSFLGLLREGADLFRSLQANAARRDDFNLLYKTTIAATGAAGTAARTAIFGIVGDPAYDAADFIALIADTASLYRTIQASSSHRADFQTMYGFVFPTAGSPSVNLRNALYAIAGDPAYAKSNFLTLLTRASSLVRTLRATPARLADFNLLYGSSIGSGTPGPNARALLYGIVGGSGYVESPFVALVQKTASLFRSIQSSASLRADYLTMYNVNFPASGGPGPTLRNALYAIAGDAAYTQSNFLNVLAKSASLFRAIQSSSTDRADFNLLYSVAIGATGNAGQSTRTAMFNIVGDPSYQQSAFIPLVRKTASLYRAIRASETYRADFQTLYGIAVPAAGSPSGALRNQLFSIAGDPNITQAQFLNVLRKGSSLYVRLQGNTAKRETFNNRYDTQFPATGAPPRGDLGTLFGIVGDPNYTENGFWATL